MNLRWSLHSHIKTWHSVPPVSSAVGFVGCLGPAGTEMRKNETLLMTGEPTCSRVRSKSHRLQGGFTSGISLVQGVVSGVPSFALVLPVSP